MVNYDNSVIYKIICKDTAIKNIYVGSTTNFNRRKATHKCSCRKEGKKAYNYNVYKFIREHGGWFNWKMVEICKYPCENKRELNIVEREFIESLNATLNKVVPTRTKKEYAEDNKQRLNEYIKQYRIDNKDLIAKQKSQKFNCECGGKYTASHKARHFISKKHLDNQSK